MPVPNSTGTWLMQSSSTRLRFRACWMMSALAIVTNLSPAISFAVAIASATLPVKVVRGNRSAAASGGGRWFTTTTGAPGGWLSPHPSVWSNSRRPATSAPQPDVSSCSIGALAASPDKVMPGCALGTATSPVQYQSNSSPGLSSGCATKPSSDMHMWVSTLAMRIRLGCGSGFIGTSVLRPREPVDAGAHPPHRERHVEVRLVVGLQLERREEGDGLVACHVARSLGYRQARSMREVGEHVVASRCEPLVQSASIGARLRLGEMV